MKETEFFNTGKLGGCDVLKKEIIDELFFRKGDFLEFRLVVFFLSIGVWLVCGIGGKGGKKENIVSLKYEVLLS